MQTKESKTADRELVIDRLLNAPIEVVWEVWTNPGHIEKWWGPTGFSTTIHGMDMRPGGIWTLTMHGPDGTDYANKSIFKEIVHHKKIVYEHQSHPFLATIIFEPRGEKTHISWHMLFETREEFIKIVKTFKAEEGLSQNVEKLGRYVEAQLKIHQQLKPDNKERTSTYLNFPGNTEEAFYFYRSVFGGEFRGKGMQRFGDLPPAEGHAPLSEADKKLILHVELPIMGGHVLMATDAPKSMGFTVTPGNNMHIQLEPETREETKRLFGELSENGVVTGELQDTFWGAYYGSCTDKYGINWMFNCLKK
jgi:uncharacterized glyoxalase superfamily protein PhnB/uncharacterized protein YndB with AHSA1/START domain